MRRARTPTVLQMEAVECGAAALAMILAHHGRWVPLEVLRSQCGVSRDGSKASRIVKVAREYGLQAGGKRAEPESLADLPVPMILFWEFNHFVVLEGLDRRHAWLNDPARGAVRITRQELDRGFTGIALVFEKTAAFQRGGSRPRPRLALARRLRSSWSALLFAVLASLALVVPGMAVPAYLRIFVDHVLVGRHGWMILSLLAAMLVTACLQAGLTWLQQYVLARMETRMALSWSARYFWHLLRLPMEFYTQRSAGEVASRVALNDSIASLLSGQLASAALSALTIGGYGWLMVSYDAPLAGLVFVLAGLNLAALALSAATMERASTRMLAESGNLMATTLGGLQAIETIKAMGRESEFFVRWSGFQARVVNLEQRQEVVTQSLGVVAPLLTALAEAAVLTLGGLRVIDGALTIGMLTALQTLMHAFLDPVGQVAGFGGQLQRATADVARLEDVLANPTLPPPPEGDAPRGAGALELRGVTFGYSRLEPPLLEGFDLHLAPGRRVALVGGTGSGKSTVARLVCGLYQPWSGEVLIDGRGRESIPPATLAATLAFVDQEIVLFAGSIRENVTLWDETIPDEEVTNALRDAALLDTVLQRSGGLDARVEEDGRNLSGGERQRLEIARALAGRPTLLVLDEATSALDPLVEAAIDRRLRERGCACLIVAHRLSTVRDADEIIVLDQGKVVQRGTHDRMVAMAGPYRALVEAEIRTQEDVA